MTKNNKDEFYVDFKNRLKFLRESMQLTQTELADMIVEMCGGTMSVQNISYWENGREPSYKHLLVLCKIFNVSLDELLGNHYGENKFSVNDYVAIKKENEELKKKLIE